MRAKGLARKIHQPHHRESEPLGNCKSFFTFGTQQNQLSFKRPDFNSAILNKIWEFVFEIQFITRLKEIVGDFDDRKVLSFAISSPAF